jgi:hypothetical protein
MSSTGTFDARIDELRKMVGSGKIVSTVTCDQIYAHYQHERLDLKHPRGGEAKFLERPLMENFHSYIEDYAKTVLDDGGQAAMKRSAEHLSDQVEMHAPREWGDLMLSGSPQVEQDGRQIYHRPPKVHRLTKQELRAKSRATMRARLAAGLSVYFMRNGKVIRIPGKNEPHDLRGRL